MISKRQIFFFALLMLLPQLAAAQMRSVSVYENIAKKGISLDTGRWDGLAASTGGDSLNGGETKYFLQYPMMGYLDLYEATGKEEYLDQVIRWSEVSISKATKRDADGYLHWTGGTNNFGLTGVSSFLSAAQHGTEIARAARLVLVNGSPAIKSKYGARAQKIADHVKKNIVERYWSNAILSWRNHTCSPPASEPSWAYNDKPLHAARILLHLSFVYNDATYRKTGTEIVQCFRNNMEDWRGHLIWGREFINTNYGTGGDPGHANRVPRTFTDYHRDGIVVTRTDINRIASLFTDVIWNGSVTNPLFTNKIDGSNPSTSGGGGRAPYEDGSHIFTGWQALVSYDCDAFRAFDAMAQFSYDGKQNASNQFGYDSDRLLNMGAALALAAKSGTCGQPASTSGGTTGGTTGGTPPQCIVYPSGSAPPSGYGASWNVLSSARELLLNQTCRTGAVDITVGSGAANQYVYKVRYGYSEVQQKWIPANLNGTFVSGSADWLAGRGTYTVNNPGGDFFWVAYVCQYVNNPPAGGWKCGCRDAACTQPFWQLQKVDI